MVSLSLSSLASALPAVVEGTNPADCEVTVRVYPGYLLRREVTMASSGDVRGCDECSIRSLKTPLCADFFAIGSIMMLYEEPAVVSRYAIFFFELDRSFTHAS